MAICRYVPSSTITSIIHAFVISSIEHCNSLPIGRFKVRLNYPVSSHWSLQIDCSPSSNSPSSSRLCSNNCTGFLFQFAFGLILDLVLKSKLYIVQKYFRDHWRAPLSSASHRPLHSLDRYVLFVPWVRIAMAQIRFFAPLRPSYAHPSSQYVAILYESLTIVFFLLKTFFYSRGVRTGSASEWQLLWLALYKLRNTIQYTRAYLGQLLSVVTFAIAMSIMIYGRDQHAVWAQQCNYYGSSVAFITLAAYLT